MAMQQTNTILASWTGWHRPDPNSPWRTVVTAATEDAAFQRLLDAVRGGDKTVLQVGQDPNTKPAAMRRRRF